MTWFDVFKKKDELEEIEDGSSVDETYDIVLIDPTNEELQSSNIGEAYIKRRPTKQEPKVTITIPTHFKERLAERFPKIKMKRIKNAIERKVQKGEVPWNKHTFIKLTQQRHYNTDKVIDDLGNTKNIHRPYHSAYIVLRRDKKNNHKYGNWQGKHHILAITIRHMTEREQQIHRDRTVEEQ